MVGLLISLREFLSTPSARRATGKHISVHQEAGISIHALREEGDSAWQLSLPLCYNFYPRPPQGGRRDLGGTAGGVGKEKARHPLSR